MVEPDLVIYLAGYCVGDRTPTGVGKTGKVSCTTSGRAMHIKNIDDNDDIDCHFGSKHINTRHQLEHFQQVGHLQQTSPFPIGPLLQIGKTG